MRDITKLLIMVLAISTGSLDAALDASELVETPTDKLHGLIDLVMALAFDLGLCGLVNIPGTYFDLRYRKSCNKKIYHKSTGKY